MEVQTHEMDFGILDRRSYIDTIRIRLTRKIPPDEFSEMRRLNEGRCIIQHVKYKANQWCTFLKLDQPTAAVVWWLADYESRSPAKGTPWGPFAIVQVDLALDLILANSSAAASTTRYLQARLLPIGRHRKQWVFDPPGSGGRASSEARSRRHAKERGFAIAVQDDEEGPESKDFRVGYLGYAIKRGVRTVVYGHGPTKTDGGEPCAHIELRVLGKNALRSLRLRTIEQVIALDHRAFWASTLRLVEPPSWKRLAAVIRKRTRKIGLSNSGSRETRHTPQPERVATVLLRGTADKDGQANAHDLLLLVKRLGTYVGPVAQRLFPKLDTAWLLPESSANALWPVLPHPESTLPMIDAISKRTCACRDSSC